jgi:hypothetical protein
VSCGPCGLCRQFVSSERVSVKYSARERDPIYKTHAQLFLYSITKYSLNKASAALVDCKPQAEHTHINL